MPKISSAQAVLDAAYRCFCRNGYRRTTMSDIVEESGLSRPTVYKYAGSKEEALVASVRALLDRALASARDAAGRAGTPGERVLAVLEVKLGVAVRLWRDSPAYAAELLSAAGAEAPDLISGYTGNLALLLEAALAGTIPDTAGQAAAVLLTFTRGLEDDLRDPEAARRELASGTRMITRGALSAPETTAPERTDRDHDTGPLP